MTRRERTLALLTALAAAIALVSPALVGRTGPDPVDEQHRAPVARGARPAPHFPSGYVAPGAPAVEPAPSPVLAGSVVLPTRAAPLERWRALNYFCRADFNRDDVIDERDLGEFLDAWSARAGPFAEFLDINRDGWLDSRDADAFFEAFVADDCDPGAIAEYRATVC